MGHSFEPRYSRAWVLVVLLVVGVLEGEETVLDGAGEEGIGGEVFGEEERAFRFMMMRVIFKSVCDDFDRCLRDTG